MSSYQFSCGCTRGSYLIATVPRSCDRCGGTFRLVDSLIPLIKEGSTVEDMTITPEMAAEMLAGSRSVEGPNDPAKVARFAHLMRTGRWTHMTLERGGENCPIIVDDEGHARYGLQRLEACVRAGVPLRAVVARWPSKVSA